MEIYLPAHVVAEREGRDGYQRKHESNHFAFERLRNAERKRRLRALLRRQGFTEK